MGAYVSALFLFLCFFLLLSTSPKPESGPGPKLEIKTKPYLEAIYAKFQQDPLKGFTERATILPHFKLMV